MHIPIPASEIANLRIKMVDLSGEFRTLTRNLTSTNINNISAELRYLYEDFDIIVAPIQGFTDRGWWQIKFNPSPQMEELLNRYLPDAFFEEIP